MKFSSICLAVTLMCVGTAWAQTNPESVAVVGKADTLQRAAAFENAEPAAQPQGTTSIAGVPENAVCQQETTLAASGQEKRAEFQAMFPIPVPTFCQDCKRCQAQWECGRDTSTGTWLGVCSPPGSTYCGSRPYSTCTCF